MKHGWNGGDQKHVLLCMAGLSVGLFILLISWLFIPVDAGRDEASTQQSLALQQRMDDWQVMAHYFSTLQLPLQQTILLHRSTVQSLEEPLQQKQISTHLQNHFPHLHWQSEADQYQMVWQGFHQESSELGVNRSYEVKLQLIQQENSERVTVLFKLQFFPGDQAYIHQVATEWNGVLGDIHIDPYYFVELRGTENDWRTNEEMAQQRQEFQALVEALELSAYEDDNSWVTAYEDAQIQHRLPNHNTRINLQWMSHRNEETSQIDHKMGTPILFAE
ncbi:hypothetical protein [Rubeoparvulum massiliense]|uniref:hypothetical protein n=1 Tax=Rubeoparvulum massiliense TaxID=1631346 RepID=UPI00065E61DC|nr:hypothetical protein [Rubeoparvulum massiliense]